MGLYTVASDGSVTLVARTASDTTLFTSSASTVFTRSFDTTGGYPSSYTLVAGTRYCCGVVIVGTAGTAASSSCLASLAALSPRVQGVRGSLSDLPTTGTAAQFSGSAGDAIYFRLS
jgi:hypothetical protein